MRVEASVQKMSAFAPRLRQRICLVIAILVGFVSVHAYAGSEVKLYAAASLTDVMNALLKDYRNHSTVVIKASFAGSATLAKQIERGAPADLFISADQEWANYLGGRNLLSNESRKTLLMNELVLISPLTSNTPVALSSTFNFAAAFKGRLCVGDPRSVPAGRYAKQALSHFGWWDSISARLVSTEDVRTALSFVERAECSLGIVYKTDTLLSKRVKVIATFPASSHTPIEYPIALTRTANKEAKLFWTYLQSEAAKTIFIRYGFGVLNE